MLLSCSKNEKVDRLLEVLFSVERAARINTNRSECLTRTDRCFDTSSSEIVFSIDSHFDRRTILHCSVCSRDRPVVRSSRFGSTDNRTNRWIRYSHEDPNRSGCWIRRMRKAKSILFVQDKQNKPDRSVGQPVTVPKIQMFQSRRLAFILKASRPTTKTSVVETFVRLQRLQTNRFVFVFFDGVELSFVFPGQVDE